MSYAIVIDGAATLATPSKVVAHVQTQLPGGVSFKTIERWSEAFREGLGVYEVQPASVGAFERLTGSLTFSDGVVTEGKEDMPLSVAKAALKERAGMKFREARDGGTTLTVGEASVPIATTHDAWVEIKAMASRVSNGSTQTAVTRSGHVITFNADLAAAALTAVEDHHAAANAREAEIVTAIGNASTLTALSAIDIESGW